MGKKLREPKPVKSLLLSFLQCEIFAQFAVERKRGGRLANTGT